MPWLYGACTAYLRSPWAQKELCWGGGLCCWGSRHGRDSAILPRRSLLPWKCRVPWCGNRKWTVLLKSIDCHGFVEIASTDTPVGGNCGHAVPGPLAAVRQRCLASCYCVQFPPCVSMTFPENSSLLERVSLPCAMAEHGKQSRACGQEVSWQVVAWSAGN